MRRGAVTTSRGLIWKKSTLLRMGRWSGCAAFSDVWWVAVAVNMTLAQRDRVPLSRLRKITIDLAGVFCQLSRMASSSIRVGREGNGHDRLRYKKDICHAC